MLKQEDIKVIEEIKNPPEDKKEISEGLKYNPYAYIRNHFEKMFPHIGSKIMSFLCLLPVSLVIPKYKMNSREIRSHINLLWLSPPGFCKSQISDYFSKITFNPLMSKNMTTPRLYHEFKERKSTKISLIVEDISVWFMDEEKIKFLEGASGEEESYSRENMRNIKDGLNKHIDICCFCSGTPENLTNRRLKEGILRRFCPVILTLSPEEHKRILRFQAHGLSNNKLDYKNNIDEISSFYQELYKIQNGENKEINPIKGYIFSDRIIDEAIAYFEPLGEKLHNLYGVNTATENEEFYRFMVCSAFLRVFEKKSKGLIQNDYLIIDEVDLAIAKKLIFNEMSAKNFIYFSIDKIDIDGVNTRKNLKAWTERRRGRGLDELPPEIKFLMESNVR